MSLNIALIDYGAGNLRSAAKSLERAALDHDLTATVKLVTRAQDVQQADYIVLPGVGSFDHCKTSLAQIPDMIETLHEAVHQHSKPFLGICVGMQLLAEKGLEFKETAGLGWFQGCCEKLTPNDPDLKIPHMGWNALSIVGAGQSHPVFKNLSAGDHVYFVHSYHITNAGNAVTATADYGGPVTAAIARDTIVGVQFHPEKSQKVGLKLLGDFLSWKP